jgi:hypothetical protein
METSLNSSLLHSNPIILCSLPSYGNLGQMAIDCLISTYSSMNQLQHVGYGLASKFLYPCCGYDSFSNNPAEKPRLCLPIEGKFSNLVSETYISFSVYSILDTNYLLIQQRSPCFPHLLQEYSQEFVQFLNSLNPQQIFLLSGSTTLGLSDEILQSHRFFDFGNRSFDQFPEFSIQLKQYKFAHFPWPDNHHLLGEQGTPPSLEYGDGPAVEKIEDDVVDGSPLVSHLIHRIAETQITDKVTILGRFCNEGNNLGDAIDLVVFVAKAFNIFDLSTVKLTFPASWSHLFGPPLNDNTMMF